MANEQQIDGRQLASVLLQAKLRLDDVVAHLGAPGDRPLRLKPALDDNNSSCNTACTCGGAMIDVEKKA
jgi:hypothetical protein